MAFSYSMRKKPDLKTTYFLRLLLLISGTIVFLTAFSQENQQRTFRCYLNMHDDYWNNPEIEINETKFVLTTYQIIIIDKNTGKKKEQYFRHSDSSLLFIQFDSVENLVKYGLLSSYNTGASDTLRIAIADVEKDIDGTLGLFKDIVLVEEIFCYEQTGEWREKDSAGSFWKGTYFHGQKEGKWERALPYYSPDYPTLATLSSTFHPFEVRTFKNGKKQPPTRPIKLWPTIKGKWHYNLFKSQDSTIWYFSKEISAAGNHSRSDWDFIKQSTVKVNCIRKGKFHTSLNPVSWQQTESTLTINYPQGKMAFEIIDFTPTYLILRRLPNSQPKLGF